MTSFFFELKENIIKGFKIFEKRKQIFIYLMGFAKNI